MRYLGLCAIVKDETPFLAEWVAYYMRLGVEVFYLYDNGSRIPVRESLRQFSSLGTNVSLTVYDAPGKMMQMVVYNHLLRSNPGCRWITFVDADEFIVPNRLDSIPAMLSEFESHAGLALNWKTFGSNGYKRRPEGLQIENYTKALPDGHPMHGLVKVTVDPARVKFFFNPHMCVLQNEKERIVAEDHTPLDKAERPDATWDKGQINHYFYRSKQDYYQKMQRPRADTNTLRGRYGTPPEGVAEDRSAARFAPGVREILDSIGYNHR